MEKLVMVGIQDCLRIRSKFDYGKGEAVASPFIDSYLKFPPKRYESISTLIC